MVLRTLLISKGLCFKTILNSEGTLNRKGTMVLRTLLISKGLCFKTILNSEGILNRKRTMVLRTLLILVNTSQEREKRERVPDNSMKLFGVFFQLSGVLYL